MSNGTAMTMPVSKTRSTTGCWTCRVRRKKCDERQGTCSVCSSLRLSCEGYGPRPTWMDGGIREKQKVKDIKKEIHNQKQRRRQRHVRHREPARESTPQFSDTNLPHAVTAEVPVVPSLVQTHCLPGAEPSIPLTANHSVGIQSGKEVADSLAAIVDFNRSHSSLLLGSAERPGCDGLREVPLDELTLMPNFPFASLEQYEPIATVADVRINSESSAPRHTRQNSTHSNSDPGHVTAPATSLDAGHLRSTNDVNLACMSPPPDSSDAIPDLTWDEFLDSGISCSDDQSLMEVYVPEGLPCEPEPDLGRVQAEQLPAAGVRHRGNTRESRYYINTCINAIFPFLEEDCYEALVEKILSRDKSSGSLLYDTTVLHSAYVQEQGLKRLQRQLSVTQNGAVELEHRALCLVNGAFRSERQGYGVVNEDLALAVVQLSLVIIGRGDSSYQRIVDMAEALPRLQTRVSPLHVFSQNTFEGIDVIHAASSRFLPVLSSKLAAEELSFSNGSVCHATGSEMWVIRSIAQVTSLRSWKADCLAGNSLSVFELAKRASGIEEEISRRQILTLKPNDEADVREYRREDELAFITQVYAAAAQVYLHVVLSGAIPQVPEIRTAVARVVELLERVPYARTLRRLAWPICVAASMLDDSSGTEQHTILGALERGAEGDSDHCLGVLRAVMVARECRRLRSQQGSRGGNTICRTWDWIDAMESLGQDWVLI